jgi:nicotinamide mononucleotide adenylyltransferase
MKFKTFLIESQKDIVVFYGGRFQPMHKGHFELYKSLVKKFGKENVYLATKLSKDAIKKHEKGEFSKDPLNFAEKVKVINEVFEIEKDHIVETDPYRPDLSKIGRDPAVCAVVLAF